MTVWRVRVISHFLIGCFQHTRHDWRLDNCPQSVAVCREDVKSLSFTPPDQRHVEKVRAQSFNSIEINAYLVLSARPLYFQWLHKVIRNTVVYLSFFVSFTLCCMKRFWSFTDVENSYASSFPLSFHLRTHTVSVFSAKRTSCLQRKLHVCAGDVCESLFACERSCVWQSLVGRIIQQNKQHMNWLQKACCY